MLAVAVATVAAACTPVGSYYAETDAPARIQEGRTDARLALTRTFGGTLSPVVRNLRAPHGRLYFRDGLEDYLRSELRPLDIVLIRSRPAATRFLIPSYFTHAMVWLGSRDELRRSGALRLKQLDDDRRATIRSGETILEASRDSVHLSPFSEMIDVNEIVILRAPARGSGWRLRKYAALFERLGREFDYNFDHGDAQRLTCAELIAEVFPEYGVPVRYTNGRYAVIPDDLARLGIEPGSALTVALHVYPKPGGGFVAGTAAEIAERITAPRQHAGG